MTDKFDNVFGDKMKKELFYIYKSFFKKTIYKYFTSTRAYRVYYNYRMPNISLFLKLFNSKGCKISILLFGDSVNERISSFDRDVRSVTQMVVENFKNRYTLGCISYSGYHVGVFYQFVRLLKNLENKPSVLVLPINMRSFSPQWDLNYLYQFTGEIMRIQKYIDTTGCDTIKAPFNMNQIGKQTKIDFLKTEIKYPYTCYKYIYQFIDIIKSTPCTEKEKAFRLKQIFIFHYMYLMDPGHRKLQNIKEIIKLALELDISLAAYITPINYEAGLKYAGEDFIKIFNSNVNLVSDLFTKKYHNAHIFKDYSLLLGSRYFFNEDDATEHLNENGRKILAKAITDMILESVGNKENVACESVKE